MSKVLRALALGLFGLFLAVSIPIAAVRSAKRIVQALGVAGEGTEEARRRVLGDRWVGAVEVLRRTVPADGAYFLVDASEESEGGAYWVRFEMAPRRSLFLGKLVELPPPDELAPVLAAGPPVVVVALRDREPPLLYDHGSFLKALAGLPQTPAAASAADRPLPDPPPLRGRGHPLPPGELPSRSPNAAP